MNFISRYGSYGIEQERMLPRALSISVIVGLLISGGIWFNWYTELPTVYLEPDGTCFKVVVIENDHEVPKDCGWEEGKRYNFEYVAPDTTRPR